jgi:hypothetical protein
MSLAPANGAQDILDDKLIQNTCELNYLRQQMIDVEQELLQVLPTYQSMHGFPIYKREPTSKYAVEYEMATKTNLLQLLMDSGLALERRGCLQSRPEELGT